MSTPQLETLWEEIEAKKTFIASLPPCRNERDIFFLAKHQQILGEKAEQLELLLEAQRRADVVREHEELHPPYTEECRICLEDVRVAFLGSIQHLMCCGNVICKGCADAAHAKSEEEGKIVMPKCPMCREKLPTDDANGQRYLRKKAEQHAKNGKSWAQFQMAGNTFIRGDEHAVDETEALKWLQLAVEQRHPLALHLLADLHLGKLGDGIVEFSPTKGRALMKEAADMGLHRAQFLLGHMYETGEGGPVDYAKAIFYSTLAYRQNPDRHAVNQLGQLFYDGVGVGQSLHRAKYYLEEAAEMGDGRACLRLAVTLIEICKAQYGGRMSIPGHSCIPRTLYWARKAAEDDFRTATQLINSIEEQGKRACSNCHKNAESLPDALKLCVRCRAAWYCGKQCQREHWKAGHKVDCIKQE